MLFARKNPSPGQRRRSVSGAVLAGATDRVFFFTIHTPSRQSWRGRRIARKTPPPGQRGRSGSSSVLAGSFTRHRIAPLSPGVGTGLPHSILAWAQDCPTQSWRGHRIAPVSPRKHWERSPDKLCQRGATQHCADILAANRIAPLNPGVGTGLLHSILAWAQDCPGVSLCLRTAIQQGADRLAARIALKTREAHCCIARHSRKTPAAMP